MTTFRLSLAATTALALLTSMALADDNFANVEQSGADNSGSVTQGPGDGNRVGTPDDVTPGAALQDGNLNSFAVLQSGSANEIGTVGDGFDQTGRRNFATITQTSSGNSVGEVQQSAATGSNNPGPRNSLSVLQQGGNGNGIGRIEQTRVNGGNAQPGNSAVITQGFDDGVIATGGGNSVGLLSQDGRGNNAAVLQSSSGNSLGSLAQDGNNNGAALFQGVGNGNAAGTIRQDGNNNSADLGFAGSLNGTAGFVAGALIDAELPELIQGSAYQDGNGNGLNLIVGGDVNSFGFQQIGDGNSITSTATGSGNAIGAFQDGDDNIAAANVAGDGNEVAIGQRPGTVIIFGIPIPNGANDNLAAVNIGGNDNSVGIFQTGRNNVGVANVNGGDGNDITVTQDSVLLGNIATVDVRQNFNDVVVDQNGEMNDADVDIDGNRNDVRVIQDSALLGNTATVNIIQDNNLVTIDQSGFSRSTVDIDGNRNVLDIDQSGNNDAIVTIAALSPATGGNDNAVTVSQTQTGLLGSNQLDLSIQGSGNAFGVTQTISGGGINGADLDVIGDGNRATITQTKSGLGSGNGLVLNIYGSDNNRVGLSFSEPALSFAGSLVPGDIVQSGSGNSISMNVGTSTNPTSNNNLFAFSQDGSANQIIGVVQGNSNQAVVVQTGNSNFTNFTQIGNFNIIGVSQ